MRPPTMPSHSHRTCKDAGWQGWGLSTGAAPATSSIRAKNDRFLPFGHALHVAGCLRLVDQTDRSGGHAQGAGAARARPTCPHAGWAG